jgi:hypothetical protein
MPRLHMSPLNKILAIVIFASPLLSCGCSGGEKKSSTSSVVKGKVLMNGEPIAGEVVIISTDKDKKETKTSIALNGEYAFVNPPKGEYLVLVKPFGIGGGVPGGDKNAMQDPSGGKGSKGQPPPAKYAKPDNGIPKLNVTGGEQKFDIELTP